MGRKFSPGGVFLGEGSGGKFISSASVARSLLPVARRAWNAVLEAIHFAMMPKARPKLTALNKSERSLIARRGGFVPRLIHSILQDLVQALRTTNGLAFAVDADIDRHCYSVPADRARGSLSLVRHQAKPLARWVRMEAMKHSTEQNSTSVRSVTPGSAAASGVPRPVRSSVRRRP